MIKKFGFGLLMVLSLVLAACGSAKPATVSPRELSLTATDIAYDTNQFEVMAGQPVKVTLHNEGMLEHDFSIMEIPHAGEVMAEEAEGEMGHEMTVDPEVHVAPHVGESGAVEFTPITPGEYEFFCTVAGHKEAGMKGTMVVTAP